MYRNSLFRRGHVSSIISLLLSAEKNGNHSELGTRINAAWLGVSFFSLARTTFMLPSGSMDRELSKHGACLSVNEMGHVSAQPISEVKFHSLVYAIVVRPCTRDTTTHSYIHMNLQMGTASHANHVRILQAILGSGYKIRH